MIHEQTFPLPLVGTIVDNVDSLHVLDNVSSEHIGYNLNLMVDFSQQYTAHRKKIEKLQDTQKKLSKEDLQQLVSQSSQSNPYLASSKQAMIFKEEVREYIRVSRIITEMAFKFAFAFTVMARITIKYPMKKYVDNFKRIIEGLIITRLEESNVRLFDCLRNEGL